MNLLTLLSVAPPFVLEPAVSPILRNALGSGVTRIVTGSNASRPVGNG